MTPTLAEIALSEGLIVAARLDAAREAAISRAPSEPRSIAGIAWRSPRSGSRRSRLAAIISASIASTKSVATYDFVWPMRCW